MRRALRAIEPAAIVDQVTTMAAIAAESMQITRLALLPREFSLEAGELTPTLKVKRRVVEQKYREVIDRMYQGDVA